MVQPLLAIITAQQHLIEAARAQAVQARAAEAKIRENQSLLMQVLANPDILPAQKLVQIRLLYELETQTAHQEGPVPIYGNELAKRTGLTPNSANKYAAQTQVIDEASGEINEVYRRKVRQIPGEAKTIAVYEKVRPLNEALHLLATTKRYDQAHGKAAPPKNGQGIGRWVCDDHPTADVIVETEEITRCAECGKELHRRTLRREKIPAESTNHQLDDSQIPATEPQLDEAPVAATPPAPPAPVRNHQLDDSVPVPPAWLDEAPLIDAADQPPESRQPAPKSPVTDTVLKPTLFVIPHDITGSSRRASWLPPRPTPADRYTALPGRPK